MPQIPDYSVPETEAQGAVGGISPNFEAAGTLGRSIENFGGAIEQGADILHRREAAKETSNVYSQVAALRAKYTNQLYKQGNNPDFDTEDFQKQYADEVNGIGEQLNTAEGKDYFTRQAARLGGNLLQRASVVQAQAQGRQARMALQSGMNSDSNTLAQSPEQFADILDGQMENLKTQVQNNPKLAGAEPQLTKYVQGELAKAAVRGWANVDPGTAEDEREGTATKMLNAGAFDEYFDNDTKQQMLNFAQHAARNADTEGLRVSKAEERAHKLEFQQWLQPNMVKLFNGQLAISDLKKATDGEGKPLLSGDEYERMAKLIQQQTKERETKEHSPAYTQAFRNIVADDGDPNQIKDVNQILSMGTKGELNPKEMASLVHEFNTTSQGQQIKENRKKMYDYISGQLRYKDMNSMDGRAWSAGGEQDVAKAMNALHAAESQKRQAGEPVGDLYKIDSKDSFYNQVQKFTSTPQERMQNRAHQLTTDEDMVPVTDPNGRPGKVPKADLDRYIKAGYKGR